MKHLKDIMISLYHRKWLKYSIVTIVAILLLGVVGENSLWNVHRNKRRIVELKDEIKEYTDRYNNDQMQIRLLDSDPNAMRKIARERYFMKSDDEDIFVLSDDPRTQTPFNSSNETTE